MWIFFINTLFLLLTKFKNPLHLLVYFAIIFVLQLVYKYIFNNFYPQTVNNMWIVVHTPVKFFSTTLWIMSIIDIVIHHFNILLSTLHLFILFLIYKIITFYVKLNKYVCYIHCFYSFIIR